VTSCRSISLSAYVCCGVSCSVSVPFQHNSIFLMTQNARAGEFEQRSLDQGQLFSSASLHGRHIIFEKIQDVEAWPPVLPADTLQHVYLQGHTHTRKHTHIHTQTHTHTHTSTCTNSEYRVLKRTISKHYNITQTDKYVDRQIERQTARQTGRITKRHTAKQTKQHTFSIRSFSAASVACLNCVFIALNFWEERVR